MHWWTSPMVEHDSQFEQSNCLGRCPGLMPLLGDPLYWCPTETECLMDCGVQFLGFSWQETACTIQQWVYAWVHTHGYPPSRCSFLIQHWNKKGTPFASPQLRGSGNWSCNWIPPGLMALMGSCGTPERPWTLWHIHTIFYIFSINKYDSTWVV